MDFKLSIAILIAVTLASATFSHDFAQLPLPANLVYQFPEPTWVENIAVRSNGDLLLTLLNTASLYTITPSTPQTDPQLIYSFPDQTSLLGIVETSPDVFVIAAANVTSGTAAPKSCSVWKVDLNRHHSRNYNPVPKIAKVVDIPEANILNGLEYLDGSSSVIAADSALGVIWKIDIDSGVYSVAADVPQLHPPAGGAFGVNGIHIHKGHLYWTNSQLFALYRAELDSHHTQLIINSTIEIVAQASVFLDDFAFDDNGTAWIAANFGNTVLVVGEDNELITAAGALDQLTVAGGTAVAFGKTAKDRRTLYVVTDGAQGSPVNGTITEGGKVVAINTRGF